MSTFYKSYNENDWVIYALAGQAAPCRHASLINSQSANKKSICSHQTEKCYSFVKRTVIFYIMYFSSMSNCVLEIITLQAELREKITFSEILGKSNQKPKFSGFYFQPNDDFVKAKPHTEMKVNSCSGLSHTGRLERSLTLCAVGSFF